MPGDLAVHALAPLRRLLKSRALDDIEAALAQIQPSQAAGLLAGTSVDAETGALCLGRGLEGGPDHLPYRIYVALRLLPPSDPIRAQVRSVQLHFRRPEPAPLSLEAALSALPSLEALSLVNAAGVSVLPALPGLRSLEVRGATGLDLAETLADLPGLEALVLADVPLPSAVLAGQAGLRTLALRSCTLSEGLPPLPGLHDLEVLACPSVTAIREGHGALTRLHTDLLAVEGLPPSLVEVRLSAGGWLRGPLLLPHLEVLEAGGVEEESALAGSPRLRSLELLEWRGADLAPLRGAGALEALVLWEAPALSDLSAVGGHGGLSVLTLGGAQVVTLDDLRGATGLIEVSLPGCLRLTQVDGLEGCAALRVVDLRGCTDLQHVHGLRALTGLEEVVLPAVRREAARAYWGEEVAALQERLRESHTRRLAMEQGDALAVRVRGLLMHADLPHQRQALEVLRTFGDDFGREVVGDAHITAAGEVVVPFGEPSESLLRALVDLGRLPTPLHRLVLRGDRLGRLEVLADLADLEHLELRGCEALTSLAGVEHAPRLRHLEIHHCEALRDIGALRGARGLETLRITGRPLQQGAVSTAALRALSGLSRLEVLDLRGCGPLELAVIGGLPRLRELRATGILPPDSLSRLAPLSHLEVLDLDDCGALEDLHALRQLPRLRHLALRGGLAARDLAPLQGLRSLEVLHIGGAGLRDVSALADLSALHTLTLEVGAGLSTLAPLRELSGLKQLSLVGAAAPVDLRDLRGLASLEVLALRDLSALRSLDGLEGCPALREITVGTGCAALRHAEALLEIPSLQRLWLHDPAELWLPPLPRERIGREGEVRVGVWLRRLQEFLRHRQQVVRTAMQQALPQGAEAVAQELEELRALADPRLTAALLEEEGAALGKEVRAAVQGLHDALQG